MGSSAPQRTALAWAGQGFGPVPETSVCPVLYSQTSGPSDPRLTAFTQPSGCPLTKPSFPGPLLPPTPFQIIRLPGSHPSSGQIHLNQDDRNSQARRSTHCLLGTVPSSLRRA